MSEPPKPETRPAVPGARQEPPADAAVCERCGSARLYRMHAVWRCADCGYKTDCCGW